MTQKNVLLELKSVRWKQGESNLAGPRVVLLRYMGTWVKGGERGWVLLSSFGNVDVAHHAPRKMSVPSLHRSRAFLYLPYYTNGKA
ncbi:hypothetical protein VNO80_21356 [Phaseolus coccineus]|uniref:Uncharacterized protein n=1 Tax=Phaseolus coccineus TaxID=3886 RepID=A0AAN9QXM3_PHACN